MASKSAPAVLVKKRLLSGPERMDVAIRTTAWLRILMAILQGIVLFAAWTLSGTPMPSVWTMSWQQRGLRKALQHAEKKGWSYDTFMPVIKHAKIVGISKAATALHQEPYWANLADIVQHRPMLMLAGANAVVILASYVALLVFRVASNKAPETAASPPMALRVLAMVTPGLKESWAHVGAWHRVATSIFDSALVLLLTLGCCELISNL